MRISFNLVFDKSIEQAVRRLRKQIANERVPITLTGYRSHITLAVYDVTDYLPYEDNLVSLARRYKPFSIQLDFLGIFPENKVVFLAPRMSAKLFLLHREALEALGEEDRPPLVASHLLPDQWVPHVTLAGGLDPEDLLTTVDVCQWHWCAIHGQAVGMTMRILPATEDHLRYRFEA